MFKFAAGLLTSSDFTILGWQRLTLLCHDLRYTVT